MGIKKHYWEVKHNFYLEGGFSFANFTLLNGVFLIGFALALGANKLELGIILAIPLFANLLQMVSAFILEATGSKKKTSLVSLFIGRILVIGLALIAFGKFKNFNPLIILMVVLFMSSVFNAIGSLAIVSWIKDIVPLRRLARFWGKKNLYASVGGIIVYLIGSFLIDKYNSVEIYGFLFIAATIVGLIALVFLIKIPENHGKIKAIKMSKFIHRLKKPFQNPDFRPLLYFGTLWSFAVNFGSAFFVVYMVDSLSLSFVLISFILLVDNLSRIYGLNLWRSLADKYGAKPLLTISATVSSIMPFAIFLVGKSNYLMFFPIFLISGFSYAAVDIAIGQLMFKSAPRKYDAYYLSSFTSLIGLFSAIGPIAGGLFAQFIENNPGMPVLGIFSPLKYIFLLSFIFRVLCLSLIYKIKEDRARDVKDILERMKTLRSASFFVDIYHFATYATKIVLVPQKQLFILQRKTVESTKRNMSVVYNAFEGLGIMMDYAYKWNKKKLFGEMSEIKATLASHLDKPSYAKGGEVEDISKKMLKMVNVLERSLEENGKDEFIKNADTIKKYVENKQEKMDEAMQGYDMKKDKDLDKIKEDEDERDK